MTNGPINPDPINPDHDPLPPELQALAADLDRLAAYEAGSAGPSLEDRLFVRTRSAAQHEGMTPEVRRMNDGLQLIAAEDLASAPAGLEERIFANTVGLITGERSVIGSIDSQSVSVQVRRSWTSRWVGRAALAAGLAIAAVGGFLIANHPGATPQVAPTPIAQLPGGSNAALTPSPDATTTVALAMSEDLASVLANTEAEEKFIALFAIGEDSLAADIKSAAAHAEQLSDALSPESPVESSAVGG